MKTLELILIILNAIFGFIQILCALLYLELLMSISYILVCLASFALGYHSVIKSRFKSVNAYLLFAVILLLGNILFTTILWFDISVNLASSSIVLDYAGFMVITFGDFEQFGNLFTREQLVHD